MWQNIIVFDDDLILAYFCPRCIWMTPFCGRIPGFSAARNSETVPNLPELLNASERLHRREGSRLTDSRQRVSKIELFVFSLTNSTNNILNALTELGCFFSAIAQWCYKTTRENNWEANPGIRARIAKPDWKKTEKEETWWKLPWSVTKILDAPRIVILRVKDTWRTPNIVK